MRQDYKPTAHVVRMTAEGTVLAERDIITPLECFIEGFALIWEKVAFSEKASQSAPFEVAVYADKFDKVPTYKYTITPLNS